MAIWPRSRDDKPWQRMPIVVMPTWMDLCGFCGHVRDRHELLPMGSAPREVKCVIKHCLCQHDLSMPILWHIATYQGPLDTIGGGVRGINQPTAPGKPIALPTQWRRRRGDS